MFSPMRLGIALTLLGFAATVPATAQQPSPESLIEPQPPIKPGECYIRVLIPAKIEKTEERVLIKPEYIRYEIMPAEFKEVEKEVVVKPESTSYEIVPAQYETKEVEVVLAPDHTKISATEPQFLSEQAKRMIRPAGLSLKVEKSDAGELVSLLQKEAEFKMYDRQLLIKPSQVQQEKVAKVVEKVTTQVLVKPAEVKEVKVPAEVKKIKVRELVRPATKKEVKIPAEYAMVAHEHVISPEKIVWQRIVCPDKVTAELVKSVQGKLKEKGMEVGEANGQWNDATKTAVAQYQTKHGLAVAGLSYALIEHLGLPAVQ